MKNFWNFLLVLALALSVNACSKGKKDSADDSSSADESSEEISDADTDEIPGDDDLEDIDDLGDGCMSRLMHREKAGGGGEGRDAFKTRTHTSESGGNHQNNKNIFPCLIIAYIITYIIIFFIF